MGRSSSRLSSSSSRRRAPRSARAPAGSKGDGGLGRGAPAFDAGSPDAPASDAPGLDAGSDAAPADAGADLDAEAAVDAGPAASCTDCVAAGLNHSCAIRPSGVIACWGANAYGRLGDATTTNRNTPTPVALASTWRLVAAGREHTCALGETTAFCWGANGLGQLGNGSTTGSTVPVPIMRWP